MGRNSYTDEQKAEAIALYVEEGPTAVEMLLGIPKQTVHMWATKEGVRTVRTTKATAATEAIAADRLLHREQLRSELIAKALDMLNRMDDEHIDYRGKDCTRVSFPKAPADACKSYAMSAAILLDKFRLEMGETTGRSEVTVETSTDRGLRELIEQMRPDTADACPDLD